jgi:integrase
MIIKSKRIENLISEITKENKGNRIKIRFKYGAGAVSVFLDYFNNNKHLLHYYPTRIFGTKESEANDEIILRFIIKDRNEKTLQILYNKNPFEKIESPQDIDFMEYYKRIADTRKGRPQYSSCHKHWIDFLKGRKYRLCDLTPKLFEDFKSYILAKKTISINTTVGYLDVTRAVLNNACNEGLITENPMKSVRLKEEPVIKEILTPEEIIKIMNVDTKYNDTQNAFLFSCFTGLRRGDMLKLTFDEIREGNIYFVQQKTRKQEFLPIHNDAIDIIEEQRIAHPNSKKVFPIGSKTQLYRELKSILEKAGITRNVTYHSSRHTFAVMSLENGIDSHDVKNFLGHSKIQTTEVYLKFKTSQKRNLINRIPSLMQFKKKK